MKIRCGVVAATASLIAGTAFAQSNVTLYGVADAGIEYLSNAPSASNGSNLVRMSSGNMSTSRWGLRGSEDLGGGLKAVFELERGFSLDTAVLSSSPRLFDLAALVGISSARQCQPSTWVTTSISIVVARIIFPFTTPTRSLRQKQPEARD